MGPGVREFGLVALTGNIGVRGFAEFESYKNSLHALFQCGGFNVKMYYIQ